MDGRMDVVLVGVQNEPLNSDAILAQLRGEQNSPAQNTKNQSQHFLH